MHRSRASSILAISVGTIGLPATRLAALPRQPSRRRGRYQLAQRLTGPILGSMFAIAGESFPWRRALLRFAADRSLLTVVDGEYCFIHLLVRDYLAGRDPHRLADQVNRRRAELVAPHTVSAPSQQST